MDDVFFFGLCYPDYFFSALFPALAGFQTGRVTGTEIENICYQQCFKKSIDQLPLFLKKQQNKLCPDNVAIGKICCNGIMDMASADAVRISGCLSGCCTAHK
jgi:hypothetical protein